MLRIALVNGPNLNLLGSRQPALYGTRSFEDFFEELKARFPGMELQYFQSNVEGELINYLQSCAASVDAVVLNAAGYSHTSVAIGDTLAALRLPVLEVHITNVLAREDFRKSSCIAAHCMGSISGLGLEGYALALQFFQQARLQNQSGMKAS